MMRIARSIVQIVVQKTCLRLFINKKMNNSDLLERVSILRDMEMSLFFMEQSYNNIQGNINYINAHKYDSCGGAPYESHYELNASKIDVHYEVEQEEEKRLFRRLKRGAVLGGVVGLIAGVICAIKDFSIRLLFFIHIDGILMFLLCFLGGILGGAILGYLSSMLSDLLFHDRLEESLQKKQQKENQKSQKRATDEYKEKLSIYEQKCKNADLKFDKQIAILQRELNRIATQYNESKNKLYSFYSVSGISSEYCYAIPIFYMYDFLRLGISNKLEGADGLYYLVRQELRADEFQTTLSEMNQKLTTIINNQNRYYQQIMSTLSGLQNQCNALTNNVFQLSQTAAETNRQLDQIEYNSNVSNYLSSRILAEERYQSYLLSQ